MAHVKRIVRLFLVSYDDYKRESLLFVSPKSEVQNVSLFSQSRAGGGGVEDREPHPRKTPSDRSPYEGEEKDGAQDVRR